MGIRHPLIHEIAEDTYLINEFGLVNMYVLVGSERSLVIDAGMGYCNLRAIVESLTDKPYDVVITHAHPDHAGMIHQFDRVYLNDKEKPGLPWAAETDFDLDEFVRNNRLHIGNWEIWGVTEDMINRGDLDTEILPLNEGDVFDLGNRRITAYSCPGHTAGHMYFIDDFSRIAFTGDCCNYNSGSRFATSTRIRDLKKLRAGYRKTYDRIFTGHSTYCGTTAVRGATSGPTTSPSSMVSLRHSVPCCAATPCSASASCSSFRSGRPTKSCSMAPSCSTLTKTTADRWSAHRSTPVCYGRKARNTSCSDGVTHLA